MFFLQNILGKKTSHQGIVALSFCAEGIALAISKTNKTKQPILVHSEFIYTSNNKIALKELVDRHQLGNYHCYIVLTPDEYRLITIDAPTVEEDELADAIQWKISDLVEFPIEEAITDYYPLPASQRANSQQLLEVVVSPKSNIQPLVDLCRNESLQLEVIDIQETTLRNLAILLPEIDRGIAVLYLQKTSGRILIARQGTIYLSRKLTMGYEHLGLSDTVLSNELISNEQNNLALEIQRSFDYVESYYGLPPIAGLAVIPFPENTQDLLNFLNSHYGITARIMDLSTILDSDLLLDDATQSHCAPVLGAILRNSEDKV